jgi:hypothetical protein
MPVTVSHALSKHVHAWYDAKECFSLKEHESQRKTAKVKIIRNRQESHVCFAPDCHFPLKNTLLTGGPFFFGGVLYWGFNSGPYAY